MQSVHNPALPAFSHRLAEEVWNDPIERSVGSLITFLLYYESDPWRMHYWPYDYTLVYILSYTQPMYSSFRSLTRAQALGVILARSLSPANVELEYNGACQSGQASSASFGHHGRYYTSYLNYRKEFVLD